MRKIIGYKMAIAVANEDKSVCDRVMDIVAEDARWELSGGVICVSDSGEPNAMVTLLQALVMYEGTKEPLDASSSGIGMAKWSGVGDDPRGPEYGAVGATPHDGGEAGRRWLTAKLDGDLAIARGRISELTAQAGRLESVLAAARCIRHWHDSGPDESGMVVSSEHVRLLWTAIEEYDISLAQDERLRVAAGEKK